MLARFNFALLRGFLVAAFVLSFSVLIEQSGTAEGDLFYLTLALTLGALICLEYSFETPSITEFRFAPPYNRLRLLIACVVAFLLSENQFSTIVPGFEFVSYFEETNLNAWPSPVYYANIALGQDGEGANAWLHSATGGAAIVGCLVVLVCAAILWVSLWPLSPSGFNLWENMPNFHPKSGGKASDQIMVDALFYFLFFFILPYSIAFIGFAMRVYLGFDFSNAPIFSFWFLFAFLTLPLFSLFKSLALVKICILAEKLRDAESL